MNHADPNVMNPANQSQTSISDDVLHIPNTSKLTPEQIAKAVAHHNRHHSKEQTAQTSAPTGKKMK